MASVKESGKRLGAFDFVKGIAIVLVAMTHAMIFGAWAWPLKDIIPIAVPLFFITSGYLLYLRHPEGYGIEHLKSVFWRLIAIYMIFSLAAEALSDPARLANLLAVLYDMVIGAGGSGLYYFVPALVQLYIAYPLLARLFRNRNARVPLLALALALSVIFDSMNRAAQAPNWNSNLPMLAFAGRYLFYFVAGMFICSLGLDFENRDAGAKGAWKKQFAGLALALSAYVICIAEYASAYSQISETAFFISTA
ncbi:MAG TPA: acyltransferase, partial [Candidatus Micrarchaeota archaeon]|nr:acyltransferase [Candidatus Micrarchaeota archaeon]